jgi:hypothetical protein
MWKEEGKVKWGDQKSTLVQSIHGKEMAKKNLSTH